MTKSKTHCQVRLYPNKTTNTVRPRRWHGKSSLRNLNSTVKRGFLKFKNVLWNRNKSFVMYYSKIENYFYTIEINESFSMFHRFSMCAHGADVKMALRTLFPWPTCNVTIKQLPTISLCELALPASTVKTAFSSRTPKTKMKLVKTKWPRQMIESLITSSFSRPHMPIQNSVIWQFSYV